MLLAKLGINGREAQWYDNKPYDWMYTGLACSFPDFTFEDWDRAFNLNWEGDR